MDQQQQEREQLEQAVSSLAGLSVQQLNDLDVETLAVKIDKHHCCTKKAILV